MQADGAVHSLQHSPERRREGDVERRSWAASQERYEDKLGSKSAVGCSGSHIYYSAGATLSQIQLTAKLNNNIRYIQSMRIPRQTRYTILYIRKQALEKWAILWYNTLQKPN